MSKLLLSAAMDDAFDEHLTRMRGARGAPRIVDMDVLRAEVARLRSRAYAGSSSERRDQGAEVAALVFEGDEMGAWLSVFLPGRRYGRPFRCDHSDTGCAGAASPSQRRTIDAENKRAVMVR
jgi:DNA-binding IclR family transcriptional regulator